MPKRKRRENGGDVDGKSTRQTAPKSDDGVDTGRRGVPEAEVEEFFAIIQCLNDNGANRNGELNAVVPKRALWRWQPSFKLEDFREAAVIVNVAVRNGGASPAEDENMEAEQEISQCIDLNIKPKT